MDTGDMVLQPVAEPPLETDLRFAGGTFVKEVRVPRAGTVLPQHVHVFDHLSAIVRGAVAVFADGVALGTFTAPAGVLIRAGTKHRFHTLQDDTILLCVHDIAATGEVEIAGEHHLQFGDLPHAV